MAEVEDSVTIINGDLTPDVGSSTTQLPVDPAMSPHTPTSEKSVLILDDFSNDVSKLSISRL